MGFASHRKHFRKLLALRSVHYATEIGFQQSWKNWYLHRSTERISFNYRECLDSSPIRRSGPVHGLKELLIRSKFIRHQRFIWPLKFDNYWFLFMDVAIGLILIINRSNTSAVIGSHLNFSQIVGCDFEMNSMFTVLRQWSKDHLKKKLILILQTYPV